MTADDLKAFEQEVARRYDAGEIHAPVHLSGGNESQLIEIFKNISRDDWVLSTWRNHYHALLHGVFRLDLMQQIIEGRSMFINDQERRFYASSIAGGILPIAVGLGMAIKRRGEARSVYCFVGDMVSEMGLFYEALKYADNFNLPVIFVVEDNGKSVLTDTARAWGKKGHWKGDRIISYSYQLEWPHHGTGYQPKAF